MTAKSLTTVCTVDGCDHLHYAKGVCNKHYKMARIYGDPTIRKYAPRGTYSVHGKEIMGIWRKIMDRCLKPSNKNYAAYGGSGITVCDRWLDIANFAEDMGPRPTGYTVDRIDNTKGYNPDNCRWASRETQAQNRASNVVTEAIARSVKRLLSVGLSRIFVANALFLPRQRVDRIAQGNSWRNVHV